MSFDKVLKNYEFLQLTDEGKDIIINHDSWYKKYKIKHGCDPFCDKCEKGPSNCSYHQDPNRLAAAKLTHILNQIYWEQVDLIPEGVSIDKKDFMPQVFSKYFTLPEAINAIIRNGSGAPICGLVRFMSELTESDTFFDIKRCHICNGLTGKYHYKFCNICKKNNCQMDHCWDCNKNYCVNCITIIDKPIPEGYIGRHYGQCLDCHDKIEIISKKFPTSVVDEITKYDF